MRVFRWALAAALSIPGHVPAQTQPVQQLPQNVAPVQPVSTGYTVTGHVLCGDTQRPARFAQVNLIAATQGGPGGGRRNSARTDLDGSFSIINVQPGDYFVTAAMTGYVNQEPAVQAAVRAGGDAPSALAGIPEIHVSAGGANADLTLSRGGVLAGGVMWDDGTPAAGIQVTAVPATTQSGTGAVVPAFGTAFGSGPLQGSGFFGLSSQTDDRGRFRIVGVPPGSFLVRASVLAPMPSRGDPRASGRIMNLSVYAPNKVRRSDATALTLGSGEERADLAITLGLAALHTVSGTVSSSGAAVRSGTVNLTDQADSSLSRTGLIGPDGSFTVPYVPAGNYTLRVNASSTVPGGFTRGQNGGSDAGTRFQLLQESLTVGDGDVTGLGLNVTPATSSP